MADRTDNVLLETSQVNALLRWDSLLDVQVSLFLPFELQYLFACEAWCEAKHVLDAGCGNGNFLSEIRRFFPDKTYKGIDISPELIEVAEASHTADGLTFQHADLFDCEAAAYDVVVMRLIVQHLRGIDKILAKVATLLRRGGSLLIIEPDPDSFKIVPDTPVFVQLLQAVEANSVRTQKNRAGLSNLGTLLQDIPQWRLVDNVVLTIPQVGPFKGGKLLQMFLLWIDALEAAGEFQFPFDKARAELEQWSLSAAAYTQISLRFLRLQYIPLV